MIAFTPKVGQVWKRKLKFGGIRRIVVVIKLPTKKNSLITFFNLYSLYNKQLCGKITAEYFNEASLVNWQLFE